MAPQRTVALWWAARALQHLFVRLKSTNAFVRLSIQHFYSILSKLRHTLGSIRPKRTRDLVSDPRNEYHERPVHRSTHGTPSSLPAFGAALHHSLTTSSPNPMPEPYHTASSPKGQGALESGYGIMEKASSSATQASRAPTPLHTSILPSGHDHASMKTAGTSSKEPGQLVGVTPREYERYSRQKL